MLVMQSINEDMNNKLLYNFIQGLAVIYILRWPAPPAAARRPGQYIVASEVWMEFCWKLLVSVWSAGCCLGEAQIIHCGLISVKKLVIGLIGVDPGNMDLWSGRAEAGIL